MFDLWAWVIMPEHVHVLVLPRPGITVSRILSGIKQPVSKRSPGVRAPRATGRPESDGRLSARRADVVSFLATRRRV
ncbi:MAG: hypothetical protein GWP05_07965 [Anaerolineaceae bacterium]|nr:hypothetical protein [Anaerolineaceae bacterium]